MGKNAAGAARPGSADDGDNGDRAELDDQYWLNLWAFATAPSPYGLGLTADRLWGLAPCETLALIEQRNRYIEHELTLLAVIRADLHNTSARQYDHVFEAADFLPGHQEQLERRVEELVAQGWERASAAAFVCSKRGKEGTVQAIDSAWHTVKGRKRA